jgi:tRNA threonylcarbamoyl adenosine modification protein YeaZ/ribosomal-protein-alanine acetyltransferase
MPTVQSVLLEAGLTVRDLTGIVVGMGPGPYTGLRVGVAAAEILGMTLGIPVHHVCSLDVIGLSWATTHPIKNYIACTDARRKELYWAVYDTFGRRLDGPNVSAPTALPKQPIVGPGTLLYPTAGGGMDTFLALRLGVRVDQIADEWPSLEDVSGILGLDPGLMAAWGEQLPEVGPKPLYLRHADATTPGLPKSVLPVVLPPALRRATPADLPAIMELETTAFSSGWSQDSWAKEEGSHWVTVAVTPSGEVVGVIAMSVLLDTAELLRVIVAPGARQAGLGRRLVEQSLAWATEQGADQVFLEVSTNNDSAIRLYEKCDFHEISRREGYYGPGDDAVIYRWSPAETKEN